MAKYLFLESPVYWSNYLFVKVFSFDFFLVCLVLFFCFLLFSIDFCFSYIKINQTYFCEKLPWIDTSCATEWSLLKKTPHVLYWNSIRIITEINDNKSCIRHKGWHRWRVVNQVWPLWSFLCLPLWVWMCTLVISSINATWVRLHYK